MRASVNRAIPVIEYQNATFDILPTMVNAMLEALPGANTIYITLEQDE